MCQWKCMKVEMNNKREANVIASNMLASVTEMHENAAEKRR